MKYVGIDLHKKTISLCVVNQDRQKLEYKRLHCAMPELIVAYFRGLGPFQAVIEATASYEWLVRLLEPLAVRVVLAHPKKLRVIAESTRKSDKVDARLLADFLAMDMIPQAYRPTPPPGRGPGPGRSRIRALSPYASDRATDAAFDTRADSRGRRHHAPDRGRSSWPNRVRSD